MDTGRGRADGGKRPPLLAASPCKKRKVIISPLHGSPGCSNVIIGVDFTKSNEWTGKISFNNQSLHSIGNTPNPYEQAISFIGRNLASFDKSLVLCFGFGDITTRDKSVFSFYCNGQPCDDFEQAVLRYRELVPQLNLAGPTSFAPIIETAIGIVDNSGGQYHVLIIIADGQVTRSVDSKSGQLSPQERETIDAIVKASDYPLSIMLIGVGDGPWDMMSQFDHNIPDRTYDNFQFVNFTEIMSNPPSRKKEAAFALVMKLQGQFAAAKSLQLLGKRRGYSSKTALPPPVNDWQQYSGCSAFDTIASEQNTPSAHSDISDSVTDEDHMVNNDHMNPKFGGNDNMHCPDLKSDVYMSENDLEPLKVMDCTKDQHSCSVKQGISGSNDNGHLFSTSETSNLNWLSLPPGVVWQIWSTLRNDSDRRKMHFVSKEWYKEIPEVMARRPWVIGSGMINGILHCIHGNSLSQLRLKCNMPNGSCYSSCRDFLLMDTSIGHSLWNPGNGVSLELPLETYE